MSFTDPTFPPVAPWQCPQVLQNGPCCHREPSPGCLAGREGAGQVGLGVQILEVPEGPCGRHTDQGPARTVKMGLCEVRPPPPLPAHCTPGSVWLSLVHSWAARGKRRRQDAQRPYLRSMGTRHCSQSQSHRRLARSSHMFTRSLQKPIRSNALMYDHALQRRPSANAR